MNIRKIFLAILAFSLVLALCACGGTTACTSHTDSNADGKCDSCGAEVEVEKPDTPNNATALSLIKDGKVNFQIVRASSSGGDVMVHLASLKNTIAKLGSELNIVEDKSGNEQDIEILIGDVSSRGENYKYNKYSLGEKGYVIKIVDNKVIINAGSLSVLSSVVENFIKDTLQITTSTKTLADVSITSEDEILKVQDDYRITSITVDGKELVGYTIAFNNDNVLHRTAATSLNEFFYKNAGYWLPLVSLEEASKSVIIEAVDYAGEDGFLVEVLENGSIKISCAYANAFEKAFNNFFNNELRLKSGDIAFPASYQYTECVSVVYYEDFGAKGDGRTNDYLAIKATHDYANECGQTVKAKSNKTYYIHYLGEYNDNGTFISCDNAIIKTNVDWGNAKFIIDDSDIGPLNVNKTSNGNIFYVDSEYWNKETRLEDEAARALFPNGAGPDTLKLDWKADYPVLMILYNDNHQDHVRYGGSYSTRGRVQKEIIIVDENGNVDERTRLLYDFTEVTDVVIRRIDDEPITINGGTFTTLASQVPVQITGNDSELYTHRGIIVRRANTTIKNVKHYVENELPGTTTENRGLSSNGFFCVQQTNNVIFENCVLTGRKYYKVAGSYDFASTMSNDVVLKNCTQSNFHLENGDNSMQGSNYWGCGTSNYTKNLVYDGTTISRFDAHASVYNGKIINSTVTSINLIGGGEMIIENSTIEAVASYMINLRSDYGATWNGTITIKDTNVIYHNSATKIPTEFAVVIMPWANHDFGYTCHMPNLILDNITYGTNFDYISILHSGGTSSSNPDAPLYSATTERFLHFEKLSNGDVNKNPVVPPSVIEVRNNNAKMTYKLYDIPLFYDTKIVGEITYA